MTLRRHRLMTAELDAPGWYRGGALRRASASRSRIALLRRIRAMYGRDPVDDGDGDRSRSR